MGGDAKWIGLFQKCLHFSHGPGGQSIFALHVPARVVVGVRLDLQFGHQGFRGSGAMRTDLQPGPFGPLGWIDQADAILADIVHGDMIEVNVPGQLQHDAIVA